MCVRYDKIDGFIKIHDKIRYLVLFDEWCDKICDRINYLISKKSGIAVVLIIIISRIDSHDSLPIERI